MADSLVISLHRTIAGIEGASADRMAIQGHSFQLVIVGGACVDITLHKRTCELLSQTSHAYINATLRRSDITLLAGSSLHMLNVVRKKSTPVISSSWSGAMLDIRLPVMDVDLRYTGAKTSSIALTLLSRRFSGFMLDKIYKTIVVNAKDGAVTEYDTQFDSYFEYSGRYYGINSNGIYLLSSTGNSSSSFMTGFSSFKARYPIEIQDIYIGMTSDGPVDVGTIFDEIPGVLFELETTYDRYRERKLNMGRRRASRKAGLKLTSDHRVNIDHITIAAAEMSRMKSSDETWMRVISPTRTVHVSS
jgi:hypothetical protein